MLRTMDENDYSRFLRTMDEVDLHDFLLDVFGFIKDTVTGAIFPADWTEMLLLQNSLVEQKISTEKEKEKFFFWFFFQNFRSRCESVRFETRRESSKFRRTSLFSAFFFLFSTRTNSKRQNFSSRSNFVVCFSIRWSN